MQRLADENEELERELLAERHSCQAYEAALPAAADPQLSDLEDVSLVVSLRAELADVYERLAERGLQMQQAAELRMRILELQKCSEESSSLASVAAATLSAA
mmetsp:Transcript_27281/g.78371  ORF Transcript_27281/g.78371 Transcript_27281/m.78371 type:complete len:102 (-) Transcript_27281:48-353(-)